MTRISPKVLIVACLAAWLGLVSSAHARYLPGASVGNAATTSETLAQWEPTVPGWTPYHSEFSAVSGYLANTLSGLGALEEPKTQSSALPTSGPGDSSPNPAHDYLRSLQRANANADVQGGGMSSNNSSSSERPPTPQAGTCQESEISARELVAFLVVDNESLNIPTVVSSLFHPPRWAC
jgi:hypothetical protein